MPFLHKKYSVYFLYGSGMALFILLLDWLKLKFIILDHATEIYTASIALIFTALGIWLAIKLSKPKLETIIIEKEVFVKENIPFVPNEETIRQIGLSRRELEVLQLMSQGLSNNEIAEKMFVSLNTIKTHSSNVLSKLDAKRRTQAIEIAKRLGIIS